MTVGDLLEILESLDEDMEVQLQTQRSWPFINSISHPILKSQLVSEDKDEPRNDDEPDILYLVEGEQLSYGDKGAWNH